MKIAHSRVAVLHSSVSFKGSSPWKKVHRTRILPLGRTKPTVRVLPIQIAKAHAQKIDRQQVNQMIDGLQAFLDMLRLAKGTLKHVQEFEYATMSAALIERQGVVRGLKQAIADADSAIMAMRLRADKDTGRIGHLNTNEIEALGSFIELHQFQLEQLSQGEYGLVLRSLAGKMGGKIQAAVAEVDKKGT